MEQSLQITFRGIEHSDAVERDVRKHAERLVRFHPRVMGCHVAVELGHRQHHKGNIYRVRVDLVVPGGEIVAGREPGLDHAHEDVYVAIRDAFAAATRMLEDVVRRPRAARHPHEQPLFGRVLRTKPESHYGFLETADGLEVYFHEHSVLNDGFPRMRPGDRVRVVVAEDESAKGPQASTVELVT